MKRPLQLLPIFAREDAFGHAHIHNYLNGIANGECLECACQIRRAIPLATLFIYVVIVRPPGLPCPVMRAHEIGILSKILSATGGKRIILQKDVPVSNLVSLT